MALKSKVPNSFEFKKRGKDNKKKVLIYGADGSGKSTFAELYCEKQGLNPVVLDIEDTNYTDLAMLNDFDLTTDTQAFRLLKNILDDIESTEFNTIIIDGIDAIIESFVSDAGGQKCYADRSKTFMKFLRLCVKTGKHLIFIGQAPVDLDYYKGKDSNPNSCIVKLNALVNEKYKCGDNFKVETVKYRVYNEKKGD